jgi:hypothetical protein
MVKMSRFTLDQKKLAGEVLNEKELARVIKEYIILKTHTYKHTSKKDIYMYLAFETERDYLDVNLKKSFMFKVEDGTPIKF